MSKRRLVRSALSLEPSSDDADPPSDLLAWTPMLGTRRVDFSFLSTHRDGRQLVRTLLDWQRGKRGAYTVAMEVRRFLRHAIERNLTIGVESLFSYRSHLEKSKELKDSTRRGYYSNAKAFVEAYTRQSGIPAEKIPAGFRGVRTEPKPTFVEKAASWQSIKSSPEFVNWLEEVASVPGLDSTGREALAVCEGWMSLLRTQSESVIQRQIADWWYAESIVAEEQRGSYELRWNTQRSIENAIGYLHDLYGCLVPPSPGWPKGISDFCKCYGWPPDRLKASLFPTPKSLAPFLVLGLANDRLAPNVDSMLFYSFIGCIVDLQNGGGVKLTLGKFRGEPISREFNAREPLIQAIRALEGIVVRGLAKANVATCTLAKDGGIPLFMHYGKRRSAGSVQAAVRTVDPSTSSLMVRRFIADAARSHPVLSPMVGCITGENFRTTHLFCMRLRGKSIFEIQSTANHRDPQTTAGYLARVEVEASSRVRFKHFQNYLVKEARSAQLRRLGNGFHCEPDTKEQQSCLRIDSCGAGVGGCPARRIVLESPKIVAEWIAWSEHIATQRDYLQAHRPERWEGVWARRLLEYEVLLEQVSKPMRRQAEKLVGRVQLLPLD